MCQEVLVGDDEYWCDTPQQLADAIGCLVSELVPDDAYGFVDCCAHCLCCVDIELTAKRHGLTAKTDGVEWILHRFFTQKTGVCGRHQDSASA